MGGFMLHRVQQLCGEQGRLFNTDCVCTASTLYPYAIQVEHSTVCSDGLRPRERRSEEIDTRLYFFETTVTRAVALCLDA